MSSGWDSATDTTTGESSSVSPRPLPPPPMMIDRSALNISVVNPASTSSASSASSMAAAAPVVGPVPPNFSTNPRRRIMQRRRHRSPSPPTSPERGRSSSRGRREHLPPQSGLTQRLFHSDPRATHRHHRPSPAASYGTTDRGFYRPPSANVEPQQHMSFSELLEAMISSCGGEWHHHHQPGSGSGGGGSPHFHPRRLEKVKFGVPVDEVCQRCNGELPASLLILLLKLNKQGPHRKDVFRAPGHQASVKSLIGFLQQGRLVNIDNFSVYTLASVLKKFLRKLPGGVFGPQNEAALAALETQKSMQQDVVLKRERVKQIIRSLSLPTQRLLVLLFGTFSVIALYAESGAVYDILASPNSNSVKPAHGWAAQALGVSVAPSLFVSLVNTGKQVKREDIQHFKTASDSIAFIIKNFSTGNIFGRENYEYYAHMTGRVLRVDDEWIFTFPFPAERQQILRDKFLAKNICLAQLEAIKWGIGDTVNSPSDPYRTPTSMLTSSATIDHFDSAEPSTHSAPRLRTSGSSSIHHFMPSNTPSVSAAAVVQHRRSNDMSPLAHAHNSTVADLHQPYEEAAGLSLPLRKRVLVSSAYKSNNQSPTQRFSAQSAGAVIMQSSNAIDYADQNVPPPVASPTSVAASVGGDLVVATIKSPCKSSGSTTTKSSSSATLTTTNSSSNSNGSTLVRTSNSTTTSSSSNSNNSNGRLVAGRTAAALMMDEVRRGSKKRLSDNVLSARAVHIVYDDDADTTNTTMMGQGEHYGGGGSPQYRQYKSYMSLPEIEERQKLLLAARSQWFLGSNNSSGNDGGVKSFSARETNKKRCTTPLGQIFLDSSGGTASSPGSASQNFVPKLAVSSSSAQSSPRNSSNMTQITNIHQKSSSLSASRDVSTDPLMPANYYLYHRFEEQQRSLLHLSTTPSPPQLKTNKLQQQIFEAVPVRTTLSFMATPDKEDDAAVVEKSSKFVSTATVKLQYSGGKKPRDDSDSSSTAEPLRYADDCSPTALWTKQQQRHEVALPDFEVDSGGGGGSTTKRSPKRRPQLSPLILQLQRSLGAAVTGGGAAQQKQQTTTGISSSPSCVAFGTNARTRVASAMPVSVSAYAVGDVVGNVSGDGSSSGVTFSSSSKNAAKMDTSITSSSSSSSAAGGMSEADDVEQQNLGNIKPTDISSSNTAAGVTRPFNYLNPNSSLSTRSTAFSRRAPLPPQWEESVSLQSSPSSNIPYYGSSHHVVRRGGRAARLLPATGSLSSRAPAGADVIIQHHRAVPVTTMTADDLQSSEHMSVSHTNAAAHQAAQSRAARFRAPPPPPPPSSADLTSTTNITISARGSSSISSSMQQQQQRVARVLPLNEQQQQNRPPSPPPVLHSPSKNLGSSPRRVQYVIPPATISPARYMAGETKK